MIFDHVPTIHVQPLGLHPPMICISFMFRMHVTQNGSLLSHLDKGDFGGSVIFWVHGGAEHLVGCFFIEPYLLAVRPHGLTVMFLETASLRHGSIAPPSPPSMASPPMGSRIGVALCNNVQDYKQVTKQLESDAVTWAQG